MGSISNKSKPTVLIVDDQYRSFCSLPQVISAEAFSPVWVPDEDCGLDLLRKHPHKRWIIIVDLKSAGMGGGGFLHRARKIAPKAAVLVTGPLGPFLYEGGAFYEYCGPTLRQEINTILTAVSHNLKSAPQRRTHRGNCRQVRERRINSGASSAVVKLLRAFSSRSAVCRMQLSRY